MTCSTTDQITPELEGASVCQYLFTVLLQPRLGAFLFLIPALFMHGTVTLLGLPKTNVPPEVQALLRDTISNVPSSVKTSKVVVAFAEVLGIAVVLFGLGLLFP